MKTKQEKLAYLKERMKRPIRTASTICFDTETTGTNPQRNGIVDLGIVDGDGQKLFRALINPGDVEWSDGASRVNGIYKKDVAEALSMDDYRLALQKIFSAADRVVGYNVSFDIKFIEAAGLKLKPDVEIVDIMPFYSYVVGEWNPHFHDYKYQKLTKCAEAYHYQWVGKAHGALADALATLYWWPRVMKDYEEQQKKRGASGKPESPKL